MSEQVNMDPELVDNQNNNNIILSDESDPPDHPDPFGVSNQHDSSDESDEHDSSDESDEHDSSDESDELDTVVCKHYIPGFTKIANLCSKSTLVKLKLDNNKSISTEFEYVQYFFKREMEGVLDDESDDESDESDNEDAVIEFNVQHMTEELYMKYSAELYMLCKYIKKMYVYDEKTDSNVVTYSIIKDMDENGVPKYCQDWIKSKRLSDLEMYGQSTTDETNLLVRFGCSVLTEFINYWFSYLCIHEDIALLYCDKSYYDELSKVFNETVGVYNPEKFK